MTAPAMAGQTGAGPGRPPGTVGRPTPTVGRSQDTESRPTDSAGRSAVSARTVIRVERDRRGVPVLSELRCQIPLVARLTSDPPRADGRAGLTVHLVAAGAGPLAGDRLELIVHVGRDARLTLRSAAATVALPGRGTGPSRLLVRASVEAGGLLEYLPEPTVAAAGCDHRMQAQILLAAGATVVWREELLFGRHGETAGAVSTAVRVDEPVPAAGGSGHPGLADDRHPTEVLPLADRSMTWGPWPPAARKNHDPAACGPLAGSDPTTRPDAGPGPATQRPLNQWTEGLRPVLRHQLVTGPTAAGANGPAVLGDARAAGTLLVARGGGPAGLDTPAWANAGVAVLPLAGPGVLVTALAVDAITLRRRLAAGENRVKKSSNEYSSKT
ncbi:MAG: urease accessory protein UreD [Frankia sp.]